MSKSSLFLMSVLALAAASTSAFADTQVLNINFNADTPGLPPSTNASTVWSPGSPITKPYSLGGYTATTADSPNIAAEGTILVANPPASQNTTWTTNAADNEVGTLYMDTEYASAVPAPNLKVSFDLNVITGSTVTDQNAVLLPGATPVHQLFGVQTFSNGDTLRFNAVATSTTGGVYGLRTFNGVSGNYEITPFFTYANGDNHTILLDADYIAGTVTAYVDGVPELSNFVFSPSPVASPSVSETFFYLNGHTGSNNSIALDNIVVSVPEPASLSLLSLSAAGLLLRRKK